MCRRCYRMNDLWQALEHDEDPWNIITHFGLTNQHMIEYGSQGQEYVHLVAKLGPKWLTAYTYPLYYKLAIMDLSHEISNIQQLTIFLCSCSTYMPHISTVDITNILIDALLCYGGDELEFLIRYMTLAPCHVTPIICQLLANHDEKLQFLVEHEVLVKFWKCMLSYCIPCIYYMWLMPKSHKVLKQYIDCPYPLDALFKHLEVEYNYVTIKNVAVHKSGILRSTGNKSIIHHVVHRGKKYNIYVSDKGNIQCINGIAFRGNSNTVMLDRGVILTKSGSNFMYSRSFFDRVDKHPYSTIYQCLGERIKNWDGTSIGYLCAILWYGKKNPIVKSYMRHVQLHVTNHYHISVVGNRIYHYIHHVYPKAMNIGYDDNCIYDIESSLLNEATGGIATFYFYNKWLVIGGGIFTCLPITRVDLRNTSCGLPVAFKIDIETMKVIWMCAYDNYPLSFG